MHLGWRDVLACAASAAVEVHGGATRSSLKVIHLPGNILETRGMSVAREINAFFDACHSVDGNSSSTADTSSEEGSPSGNEGHLPKDHELRELRHVLPAEVCVALTRPLTAYPYGGTGWKPNAKQETSDNHTLVSTPPTLKSDGSSSASVSDGNPIRILDYQIEAGVSMGQEPAPLCWTNDHFHAHGLRPSAYQPILNAALSHFDADAILEAARERELTTEERETLDGCKILRGMMHDLDASLDNMNSFAAYEAYLMNAVVPLIYGTFEELDEESTGMLQLFFQVHGMAVRMVVTRWTRKLLSAGKGQSEVWKELGFGDFSGVEIPEDVTLQKFALNYMLKEEAVQGLVLGCSRPEHVLDALRATALNGDGDRYQ